MPATKKLINLFFSFVLVMGLLPVTAFASPRPGAEEGVDKSSEQLSSSIADADDPSVANGMEDEESTIPSIEGQGSEGGNASPQNTFGKQDATQSDDSDSSEVDGSQPIEFVYVDQKDISVGDTQKVVVSFADAKNADGSTLYYQKQGGELKSVKASKSVDGAALYEIPFKSASDCGKYNLAKVSWIGSSAGESKIANDADSGYSFSVVDNVVDGDENGVSAYSLDDNGEITKEDSVADAIVSASNEAVADSADNSTSTSEGVAGEVQSYASAAGAVAPLALNGGESRTSKKTIIALDAGHGGSDSGAVNENKGLYEKTLTLKIAQYCKAELDTYSNVSTYMTRSGDEYVGLSERVNRAVNAGADVFVSFHINSAESVATGFEVWVQNDSSWRYYLHEQSSQLGNNILSKLTALGLANRGNKESDSKSGNKYADGSPADYLTVLEQSRQNNIPAVLIEHGFINGKPADQNLLSSESGLKSMGVADAKAIAENYGLSKDGQSVSSSSSIMGQSCTTVDQMVAYYESTGRKYPASTYMNKGASSLRDFCQIAYEEATTEGVRAEVLFCQAMKETGWLQFGGDVKADQCNFGGLGATGGGAQGATFVNVREGLRAQVQHLKAYASTDALVNDCVDPRFNLVNRGCAPNLEDLNGRWAVPGDGYGQDILRMINSLLATAYVTVAPSPKNVKAEPAGSGEVKLSWDPVEGAEAYAVAEYVNGSYRNFTTEFTGTSYTATGLSNGRSYDFLVQAWADGSWSPFGSSDLVSATPSDPTSPKNVKAEPAGSGEVKLSWDPVEGAEAYAVAEYVNGSYRNFTTEFTGTSYTATGLSNGRSHDFLVQAKVGGRWSSASADLRVSATPQGATRPEPKAEPGNGSVKLTWDAVPGATKYAVVREDTTTAVYSDECFYEARGLKNGVTYVFHVRALIDGSWTPLEDDAICATPHDPSSPKVDASLSEDGSVTLKWNEISGADRYAIALKDGLGYKTYTYDCTQTEFSVEGLKAGKYQFLVQAHLGDAWSSFGNSDLVSVTVPDVNSPKVDIAYSDSDSIILSWDSVPGATRYAVAEYKNGSFYNFTTECVDTNFRISNLGLGLKHRYLVQAYVNGSWTKFSENNYVEAFVADRNSPDVKAIASGDGQVTLSWSSVSGATKYAVAEYVDGSYRNFTTDCSDTSYVANNLGNGHEHKFLVQSFVDGKWSTASVDLLAFATPHGVMAPSVTAKAGDLSATVQWSKVPGATKYAVASQNGDGSFTTYTYSCTDLSYTVKGLISGRTYKMLVQAYVDGRWSLFSSVDLVSVKPYGTNIPTGQQMMTGVANSGFSSGTPYLILVNRSRHEVGIFRGGYNNWSCIKFWSCVTGAPSTPTITGAYSTTGFKRTNLTTDSRARWCTQINGGYFFHSILASNNELGSSQSHGCIRLAVENAKWIYDNIQRGTKVYIY